MKKKIRAEQSIARKVNKWLRSNNVYTARNYASNGWWAYFFYEKGIVRVDYTGSPDARGKVEKLASGLRKAGYFLCVLDSSSLEIMLKENKS